MTEATVSLSSLKSNTGQEVGLVGNFTSNEHSRTGTSRTCDSLTQVSQNVCLTDLNLLAIPAAARVSMTSSTNVSFILDFPCTTD